MTARLSLFLVLGASLAACSPEPAAETGPDDFAARIGGGQAGAAVVPPPAADAPAEGKIVEAAPAPGSTGRSLAPGSEACFAPAAATFLDAQDTPETRGAIMQAARGASEIRFLPPGSAAAIGPRPDRLNVMIDYTGVIRDLRCG